MQQNNTNNNSAFTLPSEIVNRVKQTEESNWQTDELVQEVYVDQNFKGNFGPRETNRVRGEINSVLEIIKQQEKRREDSSFAAAAARLKKNYFKGGGDDVSVGGEGGGDGVATRTTTTTTTLIAETPEEKERRKNFESRLQNLEMDFSLIIESTVRALRKQQQQDNNNNKTSLSTTAAAVRRD